MTSEPLRSREHQRLVARIVALAEAYGCSDGAALERDIDVVIRVEYLTFQRTIRTAEERYRRRVAKLERVANTRHLTDCGSEQD